MLDEVEKLQDADLELVSWAGPRFLLTSQRPLALPTLELGPLLPSDAVALVAARCPVPVRPRDTERLAEALEGIPFALELAARWLTVAPLEQVLARMRELRGHPRLEAALMGSWELLAPEARALLGEASLFAGPFLIADLEALSGRSVLELAAELLGRGWLYRAGERLVMYTMVRQFLGARNVLPADGAERHARWLLAWAPPIRWALHEAWDEALDARHTAAVPELQLALARVDDPDLVARLLFERYRRFGEQGSSLQADIAALDAQMARFGPDSRWAAELYLLRARMSANACYHPCVRQMVFRGRAALGSFAGDERMLEASFDALLAGALQDPEDLAEAQTLVQRAIAYFRQAGLGQLLVQALIQQAQLSSRTDPAAALATLLDALHIQTEIGEPNVLVVLHSNLTSACRRVSSHRGRFAYETRPGDLGTMSPFSTASRQFSGVSS